tara:strand:- start:279 stop:644 length:366 start_codon:yes stop_codon:yes gene_type:complete
MSSQVQEVLQSFTHEMTQPELCELILRIKRASIEDEQHMKNSIRELKESIVSDITERDKRDARLQHYMLAHNVPFEEHMNAHRRNVENLNSLYRETFGCPKTYEEGRRNVEQTALFQRMSE